MNIRDALIQQGPSLALQRAAADEIAKLDADILHLVARIRDLEARTEQTAAEAAALLKGDHDQRF